MRLVVGTVFVILLGCSAPPPPPQVVAVRVSGDPGQPIKGAQVTYGGQTIATTGDDGVAKLTLNGADGEMFDVMVKCPAGFSSPTQAISVALRRLADPGKIPEHAVSCPPSQRTIVVAVKADKGPNLPVLYLGREIARTDAFGAADVLLKLRPDEQFDLTLGTTEKGAEQLRPQNPVATFSVKGRDDVLVFDPRFTVEPRKYVYRPKPTGPIRLDSLEKH